MNGVFKHIYLLFFLIIYSLNNILYVCFCSEKLKFKKEHLLVKLRETKDIIYTKFLGSADILSSEPEVHGFAEV